MPRQKDAHKKWVPITPLRLTPETLAELDFLRAHMGLAHRVDAVRRLIHDAARRRGYRGAETILEIPRKSAPTP